MNNYLITIDGPAGAGKSTIAKELAEALQLPYLDTGAMFRFLAWKLGPNALHESAEELSKKASMWHFNLENAGYNTKLLVNGKPIGDEIRTDAVSTLASSLAKSPSIREVLRKAQQKLGKCTSMVAEGRDLGTVVFPDATHKFYLDATPEVRAKRRWLQLKEKGHHHDLKEIIDSLQKRDEQDRNRPIAPLKAADDAIIIECSNLDINGVLKQILNKVKGIA